MNKSALLLGLGAGLLFAAGTANAGTCSADIEALQRTIARIDTDATGPHDEPYANLDAEIDAEGHTDTGTPGGTVPAPGEIFMPPADTAIDGMAAAETPPSNSHMARAGRLNRVVGADPDVASQALARAQMLDQAGDEPGCTKEVRQAKNELGQR
jgi:hypothetical protein